MAKPKTRSERLFSAAVLRRSFQLQDKDYAAGFQFVYEGVLRDLGLTLPRGAEALLERYADRLLAWNRKVNLTAVTEPAEVAE